MTEILFLTIRMARGFGVDLVIANMVRRLQSRDIHITIACLDDDGSYKDLDIYEIPDSKSSLRELVAALKPDLVVAHTYPFFEYASVLEKNVPIIAWDYGDPTPSLLTDAARDFILRQKAIKSGETYARCLTVIAISKFIRQDIGWPKAKVIYLGCDHIPDQGPKPQSSLSKKNRLKLKIGMLNRLGVEENRYKNVGAYLELASQLQEMEANVELHFMGRGLPHEARNLEQAGFIVHLNASEEQKVAFIRDIDIFVTTSLWEGFNLPLAEAQASGTVGLALKTGAHPEVTPFTFKTVREMAKYIMRMSLDRKLLYGSSLKSYNHVRSSFSWSASARQFENILAGLDIKQRKRSERRFYCRYLRQKLHYQRSLQRFVRLARAKGFKKIVRKIFSKLFGLLTR